jgi:hypothetical protein
MMYGPPFGDFVAGPGLPLGVFEQLDHRAALVLIGAADSMSVVGVAGIEHRVSQVAVSDQTAAAGTFMLVVGLSPIPQAEHPRCAKQRRTAAPVPVRVNKATTEPLTSGYALVVDGQMKTEFKTKDSALKAARVLKSRIPRLQVKVYDAEAKRSEEIELPAA